MLLKDGNNLAIKLEIPVDFFVDCFCLNGILFFSFFTF